MNKLNLNNLNSSDVRTSYPFVYNYDHNQRRNSMKLINLFISQLLFKMNENLLRINWKYHLFGVRARSRDWQYFVVCKRVNIHSIDSCQRLLRNKDLICSQDCSPRHIYCLFRILRCAMDRKWNILILGWARTGQISLRMCFRLQQYRKRVQMAATNWCDIFFSV